MSVESDALLTSIETAAAGPSKVKGDAGEVEQYPLTDLIAFHRYLASSGSGVTNSARRGLRFTKLRPPGTD